MNWYAILGRLSIWIAAVGGATFTLLGLPEPTWWPVILTFIAAGVQVFLSLNKPKA